MDLATDPLSKPVKEWGHYLRPWTKLDSIRARKLMNKIDPASLLQQRLIKSQRVPPSSNIIKALRSIERPDLIPLEFPRKIDLSFYGPRTAPRFGMRKATHEPLDDNLQVFLHSLALPDILSIYLKHVYPYQGILPQDKLDSLLEKGLELVFNTPVLEFLESKNYTPSDVMTWAWILTSEDSDRAALRIRLAARENESGNRPSIPTFLFLFILRNPCISPKALKLLIVQAHEILQNHPNAPFNRQNYVPSYWLGKKQLYSQIRSSKIVSNKVTSMLVIVRLLRHARLVWPDSIISITSLFTERFGHGSGDGSELLSTIERGYLSFLHNRMLSLLSEFSSLHPFRSITLHERAQFRILKSMAHFNPPLLVNREGYRAVVRVQLARKKTAQERNWANMKSLAWPPWKEDKLGIDAEIGIEEGTSRAMKALSNMREAGYRDDTWERAASVLAGWDTDGSPTIQSRTFLGKHNLNSLPLSDSSDRLWAVRIRATRTVEEAWSCFLSCEDHHLPASQEVYHAMFEKIVFGKFKPRGGASKSEFIGGDGRETTPAPLSPKETVYVRTKPPSFEEFFDQMLQKGLKFSGGCLRFLISHAPSLKSGFSILQASSAQSGGISTKSGRITINWTHKEIELLPDDVFTALVKLLCRFAHHTSRIRFRGDFPPQISEIIYDSFASSQSYYHSPLLFAIKIAFIRRPKEHAPWYAILSALSSNKPLFTSREQQLDHGLIPWYITSEVLKGLKFELDMKGFLILCIALEKAIRASHKIRASPKSVGDGHPSYTIENKISKTLRDGADLIKTTFRRQVEVANSHAIPPSLSSISKDNIPACDLLPCLLATPHPAELHAYIRVLGLLQDYNELCVLVRWMAEFAPELDAVMAETRNGHAMLRRALTALRVFMERSWEDPKESCGKLATEEQMAAVVGIVEDVEGWGGWPSDEEVLVYCNKGRDSLA
ncbi:MAG: hypothetical protein M1829_002014 [Trizodia sp. TS-e1964]|nr:MAG: hypothetical protein M1829_002014 [Trizodia sp. TS-e1964]